MPHLASRWRIIGPSAISAGAGWQVPVEMTLAEIARNVGLWAEAAARGAQAGFDVIDLHGAHGNLLHGFLSPFSKHRSDRYGGSLTNRMRCSIEVIEAMRAAIPDHVAIFYRLSLLDGLAGGLDPG